MGTAVKQHLGEYAQTLARFQEASRGLYKGPAMPLGLLEELVSQADGIDSNQLVQASKAAVGEHRKGGKFSAFGDFLKDFALEVGSGAVMDYFKRFQEDHEQDAQDREELIENTRHCAEAIDDTVHVANTAITEILHASCQMVDLLTRLLHRRADTVAKVLVPVITAIGEELIESTHKTIADTCRDRDDTLEKCYEVLERCCENACQTPMPEPTPEIVPVDPPCDTEAKAQSGGKPAGQAGDQPADQPMGQPGGQAGDQANGQPVGQPGGQADGQAGDQPGEQMVPDTAEPPVVGADVMRDFSEQLTSPQGFEPPNLLEEFAIDDSFSGVLGGVGLGVAAFGLGVLATKAVDWCQDNAELLNGLFAECPPGEGGVPEPSAPEPAPESAPQTEAAAQSAPEPESTPESRSKTHSGLDQVAEPEPPVEKVDHTVHQKTPPAMHTLLSSYTPEESDICARKAGDW